MASKVTEKTLNKLVLDNIYLNEQVDKLNARVIALENLVVDLEGYLTGSSPTSSPREPIPRDPRNSPRFYKSPKQSPSVTPRYMYGVVPAPTKPPKPSHMKFQKPFQSANQYDKMNDPL